MWSDCSITVQIELGFFDGLCFDTQAVINQKLPVLEGQFGLKFYVLDDLLQCKELGRLVDVTHLS